MSINTMRNCVYKGRRLADPKLCDNYVAIDECIDLGRFDVKTTTDFNSVAIYRPEFCIADFLGSVEENTFVRAMYTSFSQVRIRSCTYYFDSTTVGTDHARIMTYCYWVPNHVQAYGNGIYPAVDPPPANYNELMESRNVSTITTSGGTNRFKISFLPQMQNYNYVASMDDEENGEEKFQFVNQYSDGPSPWMSTVGAVVPNTETFAIKHHGPTIYFRRPVGPTADVTVGIYSIRCRVVLEFRNMKKGK